MPIYKMEGKKDGKQKYRVRINYKDSSGQPKQIDRVVFGSDESKTLELKLMKEIKEASPTKKITVEQLFQEYIKIKSYEVRETSLDKTKRILEFHVIPDMDKIKLNNLSLQVLQKWKTVIEEKRTTKGEPLSLITKQNIFSEFKAMINYAVKMEYLPKNPLLTIGNFKDAYDTKKDIKFYTSEEFQSFIASALQYAESSKNTSNINEWHFYTFFYIAFFTGARKGEIYALKWTDIEGNYLSIKKSIAQKLKGDDRETPPKNKSSIRTLQIPEPLIKILDEHYKRCSSLKGFSREWRICGGKNPIRDTSLQKKNEAYAKAANIKTIRIHDFRHSHASLLANEGINIQEIARRLGHAKIEMTWNTYSHLYPREEERAIQILNKIV